MLACRTTGEEIIARSDHSNGTEGSHYDKRASFGAQGWQVFGDDDIELGLEGKSGTAFFHATPTRILRGLVRVSYDGNYPALTFRHVLPFDPTANVHVAKLTHPEAAGALGVSSSAIERRGWLRPQTTFSVIGRGARVARGAVIYAQGFAVWADIDGRVRLFKTYDFEAEGPLWAKTPMAVAAHRAGQLLMAGQEDNAAVIGRLTRWGPKEMVRLPEAQPHDRVGTDHRGEMVLVAMATAAPPSESTPAVAHGKDGSKRSLAPWSSLKTSSDCEADVQAITVNLSARGWVGVVEGDAAPKATYATLLLRWSETQVCVVATEVQLSPDFMWPRYITRFDAGGDSARVAFGRGFESRQSATCSLQSK